jgi:hypothetical protein
VEPDLRSLCTRALDAAEPEVTGGVPVSVSSFVDPPYDAMGLRITGLWAFKAPDSRPSCLYQVDQGSAVSGGIVLSPGGLPAVDNPQVTIQHIDGDWYLWRLPYGFSLGGG